jgi:hypothetical protein
MKSRLAIFWDVTPCSLVDVYWRFGGICYLHNQFRARKPSRNEVSKLHVVRQGNVPYDATSSHW